jgi:beta-xylosidase
MVAVAMATVGSVAAVPSAQAAAGCSVDYAVSSQWAGGFGANVTITNVGDAVNGWTLTWTFAAGQTISQVWNGSFTQSGNAVSVKDAGWNGSIPTGSTATFGFNASWTSANPVPASFALNGTTCTGSPSGGTTTTSSSTTTSNTTTTISSPTTTTISAPTTTTTTGISGRSDLVTPSGKCLDAGGTANGSTARIATCNGSAQQQWQYTANREWKTVNGTLCLDASSRGTANGTPIIVWTCNGASNQQWTWGSSSSIVGVASSRCLDVVNGSSTDGTAVQLYDCWGGDSQKWTNLTSGTPPTTTTTGPSTTTTTTTRPPTTTTTTSGGNSTTAITNPMLWLDFADIDVIRVGDTYYASASTMHYSPGAPVLRSYDLANWELVGHSVPSLDFDNNAYNLSGGRAYVKGIWASAFNYRKSNSTYYWYGCTEFNRTYLYTATDPTGTWSKKARINNCYYDAGLLIDDNDTMYIAYGNGNISVAQMSSDGTTQVRAQQVFSLPSGFSGTVEGSRFYKRNGYYYIFVTRPANGQYILRATSPWGPYTMQQVLLNMGGPISGGGVPHQGGLVQTQNGDWYYMAFQDAYPGGRVPVLAPITWQNNWPVITTVNGAWGSQYPAPNIPKSSKTVRPATGTDTFSSLGPDWEWNHNPDTSKYSVGNGLKLSTATVTTDLYNARNTLTRRILGPSSTATIELNYSSMADGDRAGLAMLRDTSAWIGVKRDGSSYRLIMQNGLTMGTNWVTSSTGSEVASAAISGGRVWLRVNANIRPGSGRQATFSYSTDGTNFTQFGTLTLNSNWTFFMGYRFGILNYATKALGGSVTVPRFTLSTP